MEVLSSVGANSFFHWDFFFCITLRMYRPRPAATGKYQLVFAAHPGTAGCRPARRQHLGPTEQVSLGHERSGARFPDTASVAAAPHTWA